MAAAILGKLGEELRLDMRVRSAGVATGEGYPPAEEAVRVVARHGLSLVAHRTASLTPELLEWADHVLAMEAYHKRVVERMGAGEKVTLLSEYGGDGRDVPDPIGLGEDAYERVFERLEAYLADFLRTEQKPI